MAQEIKRRLFSSRKVLVVLALVLVGALMLALTVFAQGDKVTLKISNAEGYVGDKVWVEVSISGLFDYYGADTGVASGEFKIPYNSAIADVEKPSDVRTGELLSTESLKYPDDPEDDSKQDDFIFLSNNKDLGSDLVSAAWLSNVFSDQQVRYIKDDGVLVKVQFSLKDEGAVNLDLTGLLLTSVAGELLPSSNITVEPGTITVKSRQLAQVEQPTWDGDVIRWNDVDNADEYLVTLYQDGEKITDGTVFHGIGFYDFSEVIADRIPGKFTVTVQARGDDPWGEGLVSKHSSENIKDVKLNKVTKPVWDGWKITWTDVPGAETYEVKLYRDDELVGTKTVAQGIGEYNFSAETAAAGSYTATVQAKGDEVLYLDGNVSDRSDVKVRKIKLDTVSAPVWDGDGVIKWSAVDNADKYRVELFKGGNVYKTKTTTALTYDFLEIMRDGGVASYSVKVTALAAAGSYYEDGDASSLSDSQNIVQLQVGKPDLSDQGVASWEAVEHAEDYKVHLYKDGAQIADAETAGDNTYEFLEAIRAEGSGDYSVTVTALGTGLYLTSEESTFSEAITVAVLTIEAPLWKLSSDPGVTLIALEWDEVEGAAAYTVTIYSGSEEDPIETAQVSGTDYQFDPDEAGFYWATVQAIGDGELILDSLPSGYSNVLVSFSQGNDVGDNDADEPHYVARGLLPVANLLMEITSVTGNDGVMSVGRADCAYDPPEGLFAAGIFFDIELDENLSGSLVEMHAFYDPATLPKRMIEASLCFYRYDEEEEAWVLLESEVNSDLKAVSARVEQFSTVGLFGEVSPPPVEEPGDEPGDKKIEDEKAKGELPQTYGYIPYLLLGGLALALMGLVFLVRRIRYEGR
jgi:hypothetical protein